MSALVTPPSPKEKHWVLGHTPQVMRDILAYFMEVNKECGSIVHLRSPVAAGEMYVLFDPEGIQHILVKNNRNYIKGDFIKVLRPLLGEGLITSDGDFWRKQRRLIQPLFYKEQIANMMTVMSECIDEMIGEWESQYSDGSHVDISAEMNKVALRVVTKCLFKIDIEEDIPVMQDNLYYVLTRFMNRFKNPIKYASWIPSKANKKEKENIELIKDIIIRIIRQKKDGTIPPQGDILDMLLEVEDQDTGERMSENQILDEMMSILIAGHETTAQGMTFMWYLLVQNPEVYATLERYIDDNNIKGNPQDVREAPYLRQVVQETLRLCPPVFMIQRQAVEEDKFDKYVIPKGMNVVLPIYVIHRMKEYWEEPLRFDPERFAPEKTKDMNKFAYFPFGGGPRLCIGDQFAMSEMILTLAKVSRKFHFKDTDKYTFGLNPAMSLQPTENLILEIFKR